MIGDRPEPGRLAAAPQAVVAAATLRAAAVWLLAAAVAASSFTFHRVLMHRVAENFYPEFAGITFYLSDGLWIAGLLSWGASRVVLREFNIATGPGPVFAALIVLTLVSVLSILWAPAPDQAAVTAGRRVLLLLGYVVLVNECRSFLVPLLVLTGAAAVVHMSVAFGQVAVAGPLGLQWLGELRPGWVGYDGIGRPEGFGLGFNPNPVGAAIAIPVVVMLAYYIVSESSRRTYLLLAATTLMAGMLITVARAAILGSAIGLAAVLAMTWRLNPKLSVRKVREALPAVLLVAIAVCVLALALGLSPGRWRFAPGALTSDAIVHSASSRSGDLALAKPVVEANSLLGVGAGNYPRALRSKWWPSWWSAKATPVHNVLVLQWAELGLMGLAAWIALLAGIAVENGRLLLQRRVAANFSSLVWLAPLLMTVTVSFFDFTPWATQDGRVGFFAVLGAWAGSVTARREPIVPSEVRVPARHASIVG